MQNPESAVNPESASDSMESKLLCRRKLLFLKLMNVFMNFDFACPKLIKIIDFKLKYRFICVINQLSLK